MMYKYSSRLGFLPINKNEEGKNIHNEKINNITHFIKKRLHVNCIKDGFVMYNDKSLIFKRELIPLITDYIIPIDFYKMKTYN